MNLLPSNRPGFAMPVVILVMSLLTAGVLAGFARTTSEARQLDDGRNEALALSLAESGLSDFLLRTRLTPAETLFTYQAGTARVRVATIKGAPTAKDTSLHLVSSMGSTAAGANRPPARRTVTQLALRVPLELNVRGAWTSLSGLSKSGSSGTISGVDDCGEETKVAGAAVPNGGYTQSGTPIVPDSVGYQGTQAQMQDSVAIDWDAIVNHGAVAPDIRIPPQNFPTSTQFNDANYWPVIYVDNGATGTYTLPWSGRGLLIVEGHFEVNGSRQWDGVILVGGKMTADGNNRVYGTIITGLNTKLGMSVPESSIGNGVKDFRYDSCMVSKAMANLARFYAMPNTWTDNAPGW